MKKSKLFIIAGIIVAVIIAIVVAILVIVSKKNDSYRLVKVDEYSGKVTVDRESKKDKMDAFEGMNLISGDTVKVGSSSQLVILIDDDKHMCAEENTKFELNATGDEKSGSVTIDLIDGNALFTIDNKLNKDSTFEVTTPNAVLSVRGTIFRVVYDKDTDVTLLEVEEGVVHVEYEGDMDSEDVEAGEVRIFSEDEVSEDPNDFAFSDLIYEVASGLDLVIDNGSDSGNAGSGDSNTSAGVGTSDGYWPMTVDSEDEAESAYMDLVQNMGDYIALDSRLNNDYIARDYMYYDYDADGYDEVVLYLEYKVDDVYYRDTAFLDYFADTKQVGTRAVSNSELNDASFYAEYNGKMVRYSWTTSPMESYTYAVYVDEDSFRFVLEESYDYLIVDLDGEGYQPLPLYGDWEISPFLH